MAATLNTNNLNNTASNLKQKIVESVEIPELTRCCCCFPLRRGLIAFAYINLVLTTVVACFLSIYISYVLRADADPEEQAEFPRLVVDTTGLILELGMTVAFVVALHKKHVLLMKVYLWFEIVFSVIGFVYSLALMTKESAGELFLILFQLTIQIYLVILIRSSILKMERDGSVKYVRDRETV